MIGAEKLLFCVVVVVIVGSSASQVRSLTPLSDLTEAFCEVHNNRTESGINMVRWYFYFISLGLYLFHNIAQSWTWSYKSFSA